MKKSKRRDSDKRHHRKEQVVTEVPGRQEPGSRSVWRWVLLAVCLFGGAYGTYYIVDNYFTQKVPPELVGRWGLEGQGGDGATFEFGGNGTLRLRSKSGDIIQESHVEVEGKTLTISTTNRDTGQQMIIKHTIQKLTDKLLIYEDANGITTSMVRVQ